jgi:hypothetical protein
MGLVGRLQQSLFFLITRKHTFAGQCTKIHFPISLVNAQVPLEESESG